MEKTFGGDHQFKMVPSYIKGEQEVFVDREALPFNTMIAYLRGEMKVYPEFSNGHDELYFDRELKFWGIPNPVFEKKSLIQRLPKELIEYLNSPPVNAKQTPLQKWNELGPINIEEIIDKSDKENRIDFEGPFGKSQQNYSFDIKGQINLKSKKL